MATAATAGRLVLQRFRWNEICRGKGSTLQLENPFIPVVSKDGSRWHKPRYSLRKQADLAKHAKAAGLLHLLPPGAKSVPEATPIAKHTPVASTSVQASTYADSEQSPGEGPHISWIGEWDSKTPVSPIRAAPLYDGKKRMFKGHKWQRQLSKRKADIDAKVSAMKVAIYRIKLKRLKRKRDPTKYMPKLSANPKIPFK